jgi:hypothetical protein
MKMYKQNINENLEQGDLKRLVTPSIHIDEYKSKMGDDADVCVVSFKISGKEPGADLVSFIEKGYDWVLDADISSGEKEGGDYLIFVEIQRTPELPAQIYLMVDDITNLTDTDISEWTVMYQKTNKEQELSKQGLAAIIPLTPELYQRKYHKDQKELDQLKTAAGVNVDTTAPKNEFTESLRIAAGLK